VLDHERLDACRVAVELDRLVVQICQRIGRGFSWRCDQLQRASSSVALNLAEAVGRQGADRAQRFRIARGSALEVDAALTLLGHRRGCPGELRGQARELTVRLVRMLTRLVDSARP
jgi:four helix bundle protein